MPELNGNDRHGEPFGLFSMVASDNVEVIPQDAPRSSDGLWSVAANEATETGASADVDADSATTTTINDDAASAAEAGGDARSSGASEHAGSAHSGPFAPADPVAGHSPNGFSESTTPNGDASASSDAAANGDGPRPTPPPFRAWEGSPPVGGNGVGVFSGLTADPTASVFSAEPVEHFDDVVDEADWTDGEWAEDQAVPGPSLFSNGAQDGSSDPRRASPPTDGPDDLWMSADGPQEDPATDWWSRADATVEEPVERVAGIGGHAARRRQARPNGSAPRPGAWADPGPQRTDANGADPWRPVSDPARGGYGDASANGGVAHPSDGPIPSEDDSHGYEAAILRLHPVDRERAHVPLSVCGALLHDYEMVRGVVTGQMLGRPAAVVVTDSRVLVVNDRRWQPIVDIFAIDGDLVVRGRHDRHIAALSFSDATRMSMVDGIGEVAIAIEMAGHIRRAGEPVEPEHAASPTGDEWPGAPGHGEA